MSISIDTILRRSLLGGVTLILLLVPFHAFLTVWAASFVDHYTVIRLWKEGVLVALVAAAGWFLVRHPFFVSDASSRKYLRLIGIYIAAYIVLTLVLGLLAIRQGHAESLAVMYSYISNLRFLLFFMVCLVVAAHFPGYFKKYWQVFLLAPAAIVVLFAVLQFLLLPHDVLRHFGYGPYTIQPFIAVDGKLEFVRAQSTLRGPNPLGAYLVIAMTALAGLWLLQKRRMYGVGLAITALALLATYSRSAWIGATIAALLVSWLLLRSKARQYVYIAVGVFLAMGVVGIVALRNNNMAQNVLFHTDETSQASTSSNEDRANALHGGFGDIVREPFGRGPGTAGPASVYNNDRPRIAENYFLQIGQEIGVVGLVVFIGICGLVGKLLWDARGQSALPVILLASLVGLSFVNFLSHAWADDTLAYVWWGFAGIAIGMHMFDSHKGKRV